MKPTISDFVYWCGVCRTCHAAWAQSLASLVEIVFLGLLVERFNEGASSGSAPPVFGNQEAAK